MTVKPLGERVATLEQAVLDHVRACEQKHNRVFKVQLVILAAMLAWVVPSIALAARIFGWI